MRVPIADLQSQYRSMQREIDDAVSAVLASGMFILGENVREGEKEIAYLCGAAHGVGVGNGTDALILSLAALDVGPGDEIITTPFTMAATSETIKLRGATPVYVDIDPQTFNMDPDAIEAKITDRTKVILPVHLFGQPADVTAIGEIAKRRGLKVLWDGAQAIGAEAYDKPVGAYGDLMTLSFFPTKNLGGAGDGGMVLANDAELDEKLRYLRFHGSAGTYNYKYVGYCSRLDEIQAAVLRAKLPHLEEWNRVRRANADMYKALLADLDIVLPVERPCNKHVYHQFTIRCKERDALKAHLAEQEVSSMIYYPMPLHLVGPYRNTEHPVNDLSEAESACSEVLSLPIVPELSAQQLEHAVNSIRSFFR